MAYPHIDQNGISGKSAKNGTTLRAPNFFKNGRTRLVYDSFLSQGPPNLQKTGLGRFPQLARPLRADLRIFSIFSEISIWAADSQKTIFLTSESEKMIENYFFDQNLGFPWKYGTSAPEWYIHIGHTPNRSKDPSFWNPKGHF